MRSAESWQSNKCIKQTGPSSPDTRTAGNTNTEQLKLSNEQYPACAHSKQAANTAQMIAHTSTIHKHTSAWTTAYGSSCVNFSAFKLTAPCVAASATANTSAALFAGLKVAEKLWRRLSFSAADGPFFSAPTCDCRVICDYITGTYCQLPTSHDIQAACHSSSQAAHCLRMSR